MADEVAEKIAEAKKKMFGDLQPGGGVIAIFTSGEGKVESADKQVVIRSPNQ